MTIQAGKLRHPIVIQSLTTTESSVGEAILTPKKFAATRAFVEPLSGSEIYDAKQIEATATHRVTLRFLKGVKEKMQILHDGRTLDILSIRNLDERNRKLELICKEVRSG